VEIAIPWDALREHAHRRVPPEEGDQWRINFSRVEWDVQVVDGHYQKIKGPEHNWVWSPQWVIDMHRPELWGILQFSRKSATRARFAPDPSFSARTLLMAAYYAQVEYKKRYGHWAARLEETSLSSDRVLCIHFMPEGEGWAAEAKVGEDVWRVSHDSKLERVQR
jgi:hypothetical protein